MLKNANQKITVIGYSAESQRQLPLFSDGLLCGQCKHSPVCNGVAMCKFINYIQKKIPNTTYAYMTSTPTLHIDIANKEEFDKAKIVVGRAKRLRMFRQLSGHVK